jgi:hypothetical protein
MIGASWATTLLLKRGDRNTVVDLPTAAPFAQRLPPLGVILNEVKDQAEWRCVPLIFHFVQDDIRDFQDDSSPGRLD